MMSVGFRRCLATTAGSAGAARYLRDTCLEPTADDLTTTSEQTMQAEVNWNVYGYSVYTILMKL